MLPIRILVGRILKMVRSSFGCGFSSLTFLVLSSQKECAKLRGLRGSRGLEKLRGSWVVGRG